MTSERLTKASDRLTAAMERISGAVTGGAVDPALVEALVCALGDEDAAFAEALALEMGA